MFVDGVFYSDDECPLCHRDLIGDSSTCLHCSKKYSKLVRDGDLSKAVCYIEWRDSILRTRQLRKKGIPDEEIREKIQERFDELDKIWKRGVPARPILSADDLNKDILC